MLSNSEKEFKLQKGQTSFSCETQEISLESQDTLTKTTLPASFCQLDEKDFSQNEEICFGAEICCGEAKYIGTFKGAAKHGHGVLKFKDGLEYKGQIEENIISGYGIAILKDRIYEGFWENNQKHGLGLEKCSDGRLYVGSFATDRKEGYGEYTWANGSQFKGFFKNGKQHGEGVFISQKGVSKKGIWHNGKRTKWVEDEAVDATFTRETQTNTPAATRKESATEKPAGNSSPHIPSH